jgi:hypothetical protein
MNPTIDEGLIQREIERDPEGAQAEWLATFRTDLQAAFSPESLEACTVKGRSELPASPIIEYRAFCDPSGGKADAFTVAIGHKSDGRIIIDLVRAWEAPFNPKEVVSEIAEVLKGYGVLNVTGDRFAAEWPIAEFSAYGVSYTQCEQNKSELYLAFIPVTNSCGVELPDDKRLLTQLRRLERKRGRAGKDTVDHPPRLHDDLANSVAGVSYLLSTAKNARPEFNPSLHIAREKLRLAVGNWPLVIGVSYDEGIAASVLGQVYNNEIRIFAAFLTEAMSLKRHIEECIKPWLSTNLSSLPKTPNAPKLRLLGAYEDDPQGKSDTHRTVREALPAEWCSITKPWESRRDAMLEVLVKAQAFSFKPVVQINSTSTLSQALNGRVYEKAQIEKKTYHVLNAFSLLVARLQMWQVMSKDLKPPRLPPSAMSA